MRTGCEGRCARWAWRSGQGIAPDAECIERRVSPDSGSGITARVDLTRADHCRIARRGPAASRGGATSVDGRLCLSQRRPIASTTTAHNAY